MDDGGCALVSRDRVKWAELTNAELADRWGCDNMTELQDIHSFLQRTEELKIDLPDDLGAQLRSRMRGNAYRLDPSGSCPLAFIHLLKGECSDSLLNGGGMCQMFWQI